MAGPTIRELGLPGDLGAVVSAHGVLYADEYGWDETFEALVAAIVGDLARRADRRRERGWVVELDGDLVGSVLCTISDRAEVALLRLLLVRPEARGVGVGARLVEACLRFAEDVGYERIELWTNSVLVSARRVYEKAGFSLVGEVPHHSFGHDLVGQTWSRELRPRQ